MIDKLLAILAFGVLVVFLGVLVWKVPRLDLGAVVVITLLFVAYDFFLAKRP
jgi:hypothetical protein